MKVPIVIVTYNRPKSLARLLASIARSDAIASAQIQISVEGEAPKEVDSVLDRFRSSIGFSVTRQRSRLGLKSHVLWCGDLLAEQGGGILLEDDLYVSSNFCEYVQKAIQVYRDQEEIASIALYRHAFNPSCQMPFFPEDDGYDNFFLQMPASWGQYWGARQWRHFREWLAKNPIIAPNDRDLPFNVRAWDDRSWLKHFTNFVVKNHLQCSYPRGALTTNFSEPGTHIDRASNICQVPLGGPRDYRFAPRVAAGVCYDVFFERFSSQIAGLSPDYVIDLYGQKEVGIANSKLWITRKAVSSSLKFFGNRLKPHELNIQHEIEGNTFNVAKPSSIRDEPYRMSATDVEDIVGTLTARAISTLFWEGSLRRIKERLPWFKRHR